MATLDAVELFDGDQQPLVAGQGSDQPLAAQFGRVDLGDGQAGSSIGAWATMRPSGAAARLPPQKHSPSSKPTRLTTITVAPINWA